MRSIAVISNVLCAVVVTACGKAADGLLPEVGLLSLFDPVAANPSLCGGPAIPYPNNALFADSTSPTGVSTDATLVLPTSPSTAAAASLTDGFSTTASIFTDVLGDVDFATIANSLVVLEADATPRILRPGVDYAVQPSIAVAQVSGSGGACAANPMPATFQPISQQRTRILIEPLKPLNASTNYIVVVTKALRSTHGVPATPNEFFPIVNSDTPVASQTASVLAVLTTQQRATLEVLRSNLIRPTITAFKSLYAAVKTASDPAIADADMVIGWSFTTQSISATLATLNATATPKTFTLVSAPGPGGTLSTGELGLGLADSAEILVGTFNDVPYYLDDAASTVDAISQCLVAPCAGFWLNNGAMTPPAQGGFVPWTPVADYDGPGPLGNTPSPCSGPPFNFGAPASTTNCYRIPLERTQEDLPVIVTVPKAGAAPWPVVIFQHGITGNRTNMLPLAATLANAGFVTVAIDLPLHGVAPGASFYSGAGAERSFDLDLVTNATGAACAAPPCDTADPSGTHFINLGSLITSRDNLRQAVADLIHLSKSVANLDLDGNATADDIDTSRVYFAGMSLGGMVGTTLLGVNTNIKAGVLNVPGGGVARLLDASAQFGPRIAAGLAAAAFPTVAAPNGSPGFSSAFEGTDTYETFIRFAQHLVDPADPINYATAAMTAHPILLQEVIGDTVVPNSADTTCPPEAELPPLSATANSNANADTRQAACLAGGQLVGSNAVTGAACVGIAAVGLCAGSATQDETLHTGFLSGTDPLIAQMQLDVVGPITPPGQCANTTDAAGLDVAVQYATGAHSSLLDPAASAAVTAEMQRQALFFFVSDGDSLASGSCP